jgi:DNA-binding MarR family transcriptional regulator
MKLRCSSCGTEAACECGVVTITQEQYALKCAKENPKLNSYQLAEKCGFSQSYATRAISQLSKTDLSETKVGDDGKSYPTKKKQREPKPSEAIRQAVAIEVLDHGKTWEQVQTEYGVGSTAVRAAINKERGRRDPVIDQTSLSESAQEKLQRAIKQAVRKLEADHELKVRDGIKQAIEETVLPHYNKKMDEFDEVIKARKGVLTSDEFRLILSCLHPDQSASPDRLREAFNVFKSHELSLRGEKEMPTSSFVLPRNYADLMKMRDDVRAKRKAQKHTSKNLPGIH